MPFSPTRNPPCRHFLLSREIRGDPKLTDLSDQEFDKLAQRLAKVIEGDPSRADELYKKAAALATPKDEAAGGAKEGIASNDEKGGVGGGGGGPVEQSPASGGGGGGGGGGGEAGRGAEAQGGKEQARGSGRPVVDVAFAKAVAVALSQARQNPPKFAKEVLEPILGEFVTKGGNPNVRKRKEKVFLQTNEGPKAVKECIGVMKKTKPMCALTVDGLLNEAAMDHVLDCGPKGVMGHAGSDGSQPVDRITRYGQWKGTYGEQVSLYLSWNCRSEYQAETNNCTRALAPRLLPLASRVSPLASRLSPLAFRSRIDRNIMYGSDEPTDIVAQLLVDDGVPSRGHRKNILNPDFKIVGVAFGPHTKFKNMTVQNFAGGMGPKPLAGCVMDHGS